MGFINTEQTTAIIDSVARVVDANTPDVVQEVAAEPNYWWSLILLVVPIWLTWFLNERKKKGNKGKDANTNGK